MCVEVQQVGDGCVYIKLIHLILHQKLTQHCKVTLPQLKKKMHSDVENKQTKKLGL